MLNLPNTITLTRIVLVFVFTVLVSITAQWPAAYFGAFLTFVLAACTDWLDGFLARRLNQVTTFGKLIDPLADKVAVAAAFIYLTGIQICPVWVTIVVISREFLVTGLRQIAQDQGVIIAAGTAGKWKTVFQLAYCIACLLTLSALHTTLIPDCLAPLIPLCSWQGDGLSNCLYSASLWGTVLLTVYSGITYCVGARKFFTK